MYIQPAISSNHLVRVVAQSKDSFPAIAETLGVTLVGNPSKATLEECCEPVRHWQRRTTSAMATIAAC